MVNLNVEDVWKITPERQLAICDLRWYHVRRQCFCVYY
jgi:hypothetical protein